MQHSGASIINPKGSGPAAGDFAVEVISGLTTPGQKEIPAKYLYDDVGTALFDAITLLPEYGLTRADARLLTEHAEELSRRVRPSVVIELGSGGGGKAQSVLLHMASLNPLLYCPIDVSGSALRRCRQGLAGIDGLEIEPIEAQYLDGLRTALQLRPLQTQVLILFLGSSIGNFNAGETEAFLRSIRQELREGDGFLVSADLQKDLAPMLAAYDDAIGVTAAFNLNLLARINRELDGDFDLSRFQHMVRYNDLDHRIEMHLHSTANQVVSIGSASIGFREGETIWTESSYKFRCEDLRRLGRKSGFRSVTQWVDEEWPFAQTLLQAI